MNALVNFRANAAGQYSPTPAQRTAATEEITSNLRAKLEGVLRRLAAAQKSAQGAQAPAKTKDSSTTTATGSEELGRDAFLQLLVMQMQYQDPLNPVDNVEMVSQLAQFSALEQMTLLNDSFTDLGEQFEYFSGNLDQLNFISAQGLLGKYVTGVDTEGTEISGRVESVQLTGSIVVLTVDGQSLPMTGVVSVSTEAAAEAKTVTVPKEDS
ncbi:MAG: hypothetical protein HYV26_02155 [Candidatus Hydrogenedentes bacterium]|nr:hypothetical protein [Candidatus Hydrogenedentota bacterium]MBI3119245.1 hypothetical protein [Candidatus Hydrogenedentota bacterium]